MEDAFEEQHDLESELSVKSHADNMLGITVPVIMVNEKSFS